MLVKMVTGGGGTPAYAKTAVSVPIVNREINIQNGMIVVAPQSSGTANIMFLELMIDNGTVTELYKHSTCSYSYSNGKLTYSLSYTGYGDMYESTCIVN